MYKKQDNMIDQAVEVQKDDDDYQELTPDEFEKATTVFTKGPDGKTWLESPKTDTDIYVAKKFYKKKEQAADAVPEPVLEEKSVPEQVLEGTATTTPIITSEMERTALKLANAILPQITQPTGASTLTSNTGQSSASASAPAPAAGGRRRTKRKHHKKGKSSKKGGKKHRKSSGKKSRRSKSKKSRRHGRK